MKNKIFVFFSHGCFIENEGSLNNLRAGISEGFFRAKSLFDYLGLDNEVVFIMDDFFYNQDGWFLDYKCLFFKNKVDLYSFTMEEDFSAVIFWNGSDVGSVVYSNWVKSKAVKVVFLEYGFYPQGGSIKIDVGGILGAANQPPGFLMNSIVDSECFDYLEGVRRRFELMEVEEKDKKKILVLQTDYDSSVFLGSPFPTMLDFLRFLNDRNFCFNDFYVRFHPKMPAQTLDSIRAEFHLNKIDCTDGVIDVLMEYDTFFGINSTMLYEAILVGKKVVNFGSMYGDASSFYSGIGFLKKGFDNDFWEKTKKNRDRMIYFYHVYKQFSVKNGIGDKNIKYIDSVFFDCD